MNWLVQASVKFKKIRSVMSDQGPKNDELHCSFCGNSQSEVRNLIAGPGVFICSECVDLCSATLRKQLAERNLLRGSGNPTPRQIRELLDRSEEHTSELQSLMRISYAVFCLKNKQKKIHNNP